MVAHSRKSVVALVMGGLVLAFVAPMLLGAGVAGAALPKATTVIVNADEYSFAPSTPRAPAGRVRFVVHNDGRMEHDLVILRTDRAPNAIPLKGKTGRTVEHGKGVKKMGAIRRIRSGEIKSDTVRLPAGHYVLVCSIAGHYAAGMFSEFVVS
jgi:uncharacterized cupredoxin-like copper-binding protein